MPTKYTSSIIIYYFLMEIFWFFNYFRKTRVYEKKKVFARLQPKQQYCVHPYVLINNAADVSVVKILCLPPTPTLG